eukprot:5547238-Prymnesium_polylepis.1
MAGSRSGGPSGTGGAAAAASAKPLKAPAKASGASPKKPPSIFGADWREAKITAHEATSL